MIVPMHKFSFLVFHQDYAQFLDDVRDIGVVHLIEKQSEVSDAVRTQYDRIKQVQSVVKQLQKREVEGEPKSAVKVNGEAAFEDVSRLYNDLEEKYQQLILLDKEISQVKPWGDFSKETLDKLAEQGLQTRFYTAPNSKFDESWLNDYPIEVIGQQAGQVFFILIQKGTEEPSIDAEEIRPPERPLSELLYYKKKLEEDLASINEEIDDHAVRSLEAIKKYGYEIKESAEYEKAVENTEKQADEKVMLLEGWVPGEKKGTLVDYLESNNILYITQEAEPKEKTPILLKNKKFARKFEMLGDLYSLPQYNELDLTPFFAPFYMLFFGFCLGDAGYGILMSFVALFMQKKAKKKEIKKIMGLVFYLGVSTFLFGVISGVFFGINLFNTSLPVYSDLATRFEQQGTDINMLLFYLSLILGGIQITFGLILKAINETRQFGWKQALGTVGWILLIFGLLSMYATSEITGIPFGEMNLALYTLLGVSGALILFLNNLNRHVLMNFGLGLWNTYNMVTGILGDLLSYIRLFALGISSAILGFVFNSLALEMSGSIPVLNIVIMVLILVIGHSINLFMSGLGAFVHPMRLTFVEFYKNAGFNGGGKRYNPFRKFI